jgi:hypothetical protein
MLTSPAVLLLSMARMPSKRGSEVEAHRVGCKTFSRCLLADLVVDVHNGSGEGRMLYTL